MPLVPALEICFVSKGLLVPLPCLPQMHPAGVLRGPPSHQHHHHLPQRGPLHPAQNHPQVRALPSVSLPGWCLVRACLPTWGGGPVQVFLSTCQALFRTLHMYLLVVTPHAPMRAAIIPLYRRKDRGLRHWVTYRRSLEVIEDLVPEHVPLTTA